MCKILGYLQVGVVSEDIIKVLRLGKRNTDGASPKPILIQLGSRHVKNLVTESLYKIKSLEVKFQGVIMSHDMTKKQREECKALVLYAAICEKEKGIPYMGCFSCAFGSYCRVPSSYQRKPLKT